MKRIDHHLSEVKAYETLNNAGLTGVVCPCFYGSVRFDNQFVETHMDVLFNRRDEQKGLSYSFNSDLVLEFQLRYTMT